MEIGASRCSVMRLMSISLRLRHLEMYLGCIQMLGNVTQAHLLAPRHIQVPYNATQVHFLAPKRIQVLYNPGSSPCFSGASKCSITLAHLLASQAPRNAPRAHRSAYTKSKTLAEMEVLSYNENGNGNLEVVSLACGLVGGDNTLLSYLTASVAVMVSQITGDLSAYNSLRFLQELLGSIPMVHIDDVREAHIFCIEKESLRGRFLCTPADPTAKEIANYYQENYPRLKISEELMGGPDRGSRCDSTKLVEMRFEFKYDMKKILDDCVACQSRLKALSSI
ncbi:hypothetical protein RHGRI_005990 [Rhododendron griersonianum]|uniref:Anthocyanidin reductase n=1 Tax=Rhododendron griersonianum TaxID=479676 RepID=A0AAV6LGI9_9ERIC|nr:hypothetical protein RHGRI_005990 [Rhododendron griersonianum]